MKRLSESFTPSLLSIAAIQGEIMDELGPSSETASEVEDEFLHEAIYAKGIEPTFLTKDANGYVYATTDINECHEFSELLNLKRYESAIKETIDLAIRCMHEDSEERIKRLVLIRQFIKLVGSSYFSVDSYMSRNPQEVYRDVIFHALQSKKLYKPENWAARGALKLTKKLGAKAVDVTASTYKELLAMKSNAAKEEAKRVEKWSSFLMNRVILGSNMAERAGDSAMAHANHLSALREDVTDYLAQRIFELVYKSPKIIEAIQTRAEKMQGVDLAYASIGKEVREAIFSVAQRLKDEISVSYYSAGVQALKSQLGIKVAKGINETISRVNDKLLSIGDVNNIEEILAAVREGLNDMSIKVKWSLKNEPAQKYSTNILEGVDEVDPGYAAGSALRILQKAEQKSEAGYVRISDTQYAVLLNIISDLEKRL